MRALGSILPAVLENCAAAMRVRKASAASVYAPVKCDEDFDPITGEILDAENSDRRKFELLNLMRELDPRQESFDYDRDYYKAKRQAHWPYLIAADKAVIQEVERGRAAQFAVIREQAA